MPTPDGNRLLRNLPREEYERIAPHLAPVVLPTRHVLYEPGARLTHVYFPHRGVLSLLTVLRDGTAVEVGMVGREGFAGTAAALGVDTPAVRCLVQVPVEASSMRVQALRRHLARGGAFERRIHRFAHALFEQAMQFVACNRRHTLRERCARWLLMTADRVGRDEFHLTQEFLSYMLGVHRPGVATVLGELRAARLVLPGRGSIRILDRRALEAASCECYATIRRQLRRTMSA